MKKILEEYNVSIQRDEGTGQILREEWKNKEGVHEHPKRGHAAEKRFDPETGKLVFQVFFKDGEAHRDGDKPAIMEFDPCTDMLVGELYCMSGKDHRENGPAHIKRDAATGKTTFELWKQHGKDHRADGKPACIFRNPATNVIYMEKYYVRDKLHRKDGPAIIVRDENTGEILEQTYYLDGAKLENLPFDIPDPSDH